MTTYLYYFQVSNSRRGGRNKQGGWQISAKIINGKGAINREVGKKSLKLINGEVGINREARKNSTIRNFIELKSTKDLVKISTKRT